MRLILHKIVTVSDFRQIVALDPDIKERTGPFTFDP
jgi:hypothetical protein